MGQDGISLKRKKNKTKGVLVLAGLPSEFLTSAALPSGAPEPRVESGVCIAWAHRGCPAGHLW